MLEKLNEGFQYFLDQGDPRVKNWPLMQTPFPGYAMIAAYIYFVTVAGPRFMKNRQPYQLNTLMVIYNFLMVIINFAVFMGIGWYGWFDGYSLVCQPVDYSNAHKAVMMVRFGYLFYLTKFVEFSDTLFFVFRKKYSQITALHVIHHSIVPFSLWFGIKYAPGGHNSLFPFMNSLVHVIMYSYYGLAAMGEKYKKYLFWKKYMTYIQLFQFVVIIIHTASLVINKCDSTYIFISLNFLHALLFFGLFLNFFFQTYMKKSGYKSVSSSPASSTKLQPNHKSTEIICNGKLMENGNGSVKPRLLHNLEDSNINSNLPRETQRLQDSNGDCSAYMSSSKECDSPLNDITNGKVKST